MAVFLFLHHHPDNSASAQKRESSGGTDEPVKQYRVSDEIESAKEREQEICCFHFVMVGRLYYLSSEKTAKIGFSLKRPVKNS